MSNYNRVLKENSILDSERLILRPFNIKDVEDVFFYASDNLVTKFLRWPTHVNIGETEEILKKSFLNKAGIYAIELKKENKCIGCIELRICEKHDKASFGYVLNREYWNNGYMTEALELILSLSFSKCETSNYFILKKSHNLRLVTL